MKQLEQTLTSMEVSEMVGKNHKELMRDIRRYCNQISKANEELEGERKIALSDFFKESTYKNSQNKTQPCFDITKKGCEFIAHKLTGVKGTAFTAQYINRFHDMEQALKNPQAEIPEKDPFEHWEIRWKHETETWFSKNNWKLSIILERFGWLENFYTTRFSWNYRICTTYAQSKRHITPVMDIHRNTLLICLILIETSTIRRQDTSITYLLKNKRQNKHEFRNH